MFTQMTSARWTLSCPPNHTHTHTLAHRHTYTHTQGCRSFGAKGELGSGAWGVRWWRCVCWKDREWGNDSCWHLEQDRDWRELQDSQNLNLWCLSCFFMCIINNPARLICSYEWLYFLGFDHWLISSDEFCEVMCAAQGCCGSWSVFWIHLVRSNWGEWVGQGEG